MVYPRRSSPCSHTHFEVDSTESVWYTSARCSQLLQSILKLTPQRQYGILADVAARVGLILKLTPQSQYGIVGEAATRRELTF